MMKNLENKTGWMVGGGILGALAASICCIGPLVLTVLGVSGAAVLSRLEFLRVPMIFLVVLLFSVAGYSLFRKKDRCEPESVCADPKKYGVMVIIYWVGLLVALVGITSTQWITWFF